MGMLDGKIQQGSSYSQKFKVATVTSPHSGHFMTSNLDDDDDTVDGLGRGLGVEGPDPSVAGIVFSHGKSQKGYDFEDACKKPRDTYRFISPNNKHYVKDFDNSLSKMFACMTVAYSGQLSTPKFKAFKGMKINVWDKMRLNNIIWREWHLQFVKMNKPLVCSFTINMDVHNKPQAVILEGKYWKRKLDIVCVEYQKWRRFYRQRIMPKNAANLGIEELLARVAGKEGHDLYHSQSRDSFQADEDQFAMDFTDTLFSTLSQGGHNQPPPKDDYFGGCANSDFIQPHLIGLQPSLDDFTNSESMEPFQDLFNEAFGLNPTAHTTAQSSTSFLAGSDQHQPHPFYQPQPLPVTFGQQLGFQSTPAPTVESKSIAPLVFAAPVMPSLRYVTVVQPNSSQQGSVWQQPLQQPLQPAAVSKETANKPVHIAPKAAASQSTTVTPFLTRLLTAKKKSIVPDLVAVSGIDTPLSSSSQVSVTPFSQHSTLGEKQEEGAVSRSISNEGFPLVPVPEDRVEHQASQFTCSTAEQKRRSNIKNGFEAIQTLVPALANNPNNKVSKATMLIKTAEFAQKLKRERQELQSEADMLQQEIDALNAAISSCQSQLPATGVPLTGQHTSQMKEILDAYITERTTQNWKFYIFSQLASPLFDSFSTMVSTASVDELYRTTQTWLDQHCTLPALRPAILNSLRTIGTDTSILSDPSALPEQARAAVLTKNYSTAGPIDQDSQFSTYLSQTTNLPS
ncbi:carbohydrate-responsive element-binding protein-like isoform X2 [Watersipora subatra]